MPVWPEITPLVAIIVGPIAGMLGAAVVAWFTLRGRRAEEETKLAAIRAEQDTKLSGVRDAALVKTFEIVERSRDDVFTQLAGERTRREALEARSAERDSKLVQLETEVRMLRELQCPMAVTGACPVFRTRSIIVASG